MKTLAMILILLVGGAAMAQTDPRFVGPPLRSADGSIKRSTYQRALFIRMHPCPSSAEATGACPGWGVDHVIPLACGGADTPVNMQWLPLGIKTCAVGGVPCKDRWERRIYHTTIPC